VNNTPLRNHASKVNSICFTCHSSIDELPHRFVIVKDKIFKKHKKISFHYFFPCWDIDYICQNLGEYEIFKAGFHCDESILKNPKAVNNMRKNADLWDMEVTV
jgi:hypothetical protein